MNALLLSVLKHNKGKKTTQGKLTNFVSAKIQQILVL